MQKFCVTRTKGDKVEVLYIADSKEDGMNKGEEIAKTANPADGIITLERGEFDAEGNRIGNQWTLYEVWD